MSSPSVERDAPDPPSMGGPPPRRVVTQVESLSALVGGHPDALRKIFGAGRATDPAELGEVTRGLLLAFAPGADVFLAFRPLLRALAADVLPWRGKTFDHGGNSGQNLILGRRVFRFQAEEGPSLIDGRPALVLTYDAPAHENPWPVRAVRDELRTVGPGIAIGPAVFTGHERRASVPLLWFGLETARAS